MARFGIVFGLNGERGFDNVDYGKEVINEGNGDRLLLLKDMDYKDVLKNYNGPPESGSWVHLFIHGSSPTFWDSQRKHLESGGLKIKSEKEFSHGSAFPPFDELYTIFKKEPEGEWQRILANLLGEGDFSHKLWTLELAALSCVNHALSSTEGTDERNNRMDAVCNLELSKTFDYEPYDSDEKMLTALLPSYLSLFKP